MTANPRDRDSDETTENGAERQGAATTWEPCPECFGDGFNMVPYEGPRICGPCRGTGAAVVVDRDVKPDKYDLAAAYLRVVSRAS